MTQNGWLRFRRSDGIHILVNLAQVAAISPSMNQRRVMLVFADGSSIEVYGEIDSLERTVTQ